MKQFFGMAKKDHFGNGADCYKIVVACDDTRLRLANQRGTTAPFNGGCTTYLSMVDGGGHWGVRDPAAKLNAIIRQRKPSDDGAVAQECT